MGIRNMVMLKALWRKTARQAFFDASDASNDDSGDLNLADHLTHTGQFHLERLQMLLRLRFREQYDAESDDHVRQMIRYASRIQDKDIQRELLLLYLNCPPAIQDHLRDDDLIDQEHYIHQYTSR